MREPANAVAGRASPARGTARHRSVDGSLHPHDGAPEPAVVRRPATGEPIRRYEPPHPGSLVHVDVKRTGNIPDGGAWRYVGRRQGERNRAATPGKPRNQYGGLKLGYAFVHTVIDDRSRVAYTEVDDDETAVTAVAALHRAVDWSAERGFTVERVLSDNGGAYRSHLWRDTCEALSITPKRTRPYRLRQPAAVLTIDRPPRSVQLAHDRRAAPSSVSRGWAENQHEARLGARSVGDGYPISDLDEPAIASYVISTTSNYERLRPFLDRGGTRASSWISPGTDRSGRG